MRPLSEIAREINDLRQRIHVLEREAEASARDEMQRQRQTVPPHACQGARWCEGE